MARGIVFREIPSRLAKKMKNDEGFARSAGSPLRWRADGTPTIRSGEHKAVVITWETWKCCIRPVIGKSIADDCLKWNRVLSRALERLEPDDGKLSSPVLRGGGWR